jgi:hypothetical protein
VKYLILIYGNPRSWRHPLFAQAPEFLALPAPERDELVGRWEALREEITASGELVSGVALDAPATTRTIRVRDEAAFSTDGPYAESKEHLAGYLVVECASAERATDIAARIPDARFAAVEVRPILDAR